jgi:hypothetical protein
LFQGRGQKGTTGEVVRAAQQTSGALVDGEHRLFGQEGGFSSGDGEVVGEIVAHMIELEGLQVGPSDDA